MSNRHYLLSSLALGALAVMSVPAQAEVRQVQQFDIPAQDLGSALRAFARASGAQVIFDGKAVRGKRSEALRHRSGAEEALRELLRGTGMSYRRNGKIFIVSPMRRVAQAQADLANASPMAPAETATHGISDSNDIIVTAQKKEEKLIDVPIAMTALSSAALDDRKIEGGAELLRAVPNMNFSKGNFSMYNIAIRGIGTKAVSASTDPAVAVSFNNTPLIRNRLFESEFFDMQRVEVLRGPQGTLYGRNATGGVVNLIPALPDQDFGLDAKVEVGNYKSMRVSGMINVPLTDTLAVRAAGALTSRDGFDYNSFTQKRVNGRELWSTRTSIAWEPGDRFRANAIWQHFKEDDNRSRTGKQLCARDEGPATVGGIRVPDGTQDEVFGREVDLRSRLSQGCLPVSLYDDRSYGAPNAGGYAPIVAGSTDYVKIGYPAGGSTPISGLTPGDPFAGVRQSRNLREIATSIDPVFRAKNDIFQLNLEYDLSDGLKLVSQTAYARDRYYSSQDYNRFVSAPVFIDTAGLVDGPPGTPEIIIEIPGIPPIIIPGTPEPNPIDQSHASPGGIFCDPQLGCSDRMLSADLSRSRNRQWSQEFRLQSAFDGPFNFSLGVNYLNFKSQDDYFVFNNLYTFIAYNRYNRLSDGTRGSEFQYADCPPDVTDRDCIYVDPNPIASLDGDGHNYFRSRNDVRTKSWALFGEAYWNVTDTLKVTAGLRVTRDDKRAILYPSQILLGGGGALNGSSGGIISGGYKANDPLNQRWTKPTGRLVIDWKPDLAFTDDTLIYASASHGYKGGGANPARPGINVGNVQFGEISPTFRPEYVNAFEIGTKNSFDGGRLTLNATGFFYDYKGYQVSQIVDRIALNENFDATSWGLELEAAWRPSRAFRLDANLGYLQTRLKKGARSIDVMNRTQGNPDWVLLRPFLQVPSNCIAPRAYVERILQDPSSATAGGALYALCGQSKGLGSFDPRDTLGFYSQIYGFTYDPFAPYDPAKVGALVPYDPANPTAWQGQVSGAPNSGRGFYADLSGNELPNSPRITANVGAQYTFFLGDWDLTFRGDYYRQSKSFARVYNTAYDRLKAWDNVNLAVTLARPDSDLSFQLYVKNLFNDAPITDFFTNSDDSMLSTNVFTLDPRVIGFSATKRF